MAENKKKSILENYEYLHVDQTNKKALLVPSLADIERMVEAEEIKDGDLIIKLTEQTIQVAELVHHIKLL